MAKEKKYSTDEVIEMMVHYSNFKAFQNFLEGYKKGKDDVFNISKIKQLERLSEMAYNTFVPKEIKEILEKRDDAAEKVLNTAEEKSLTSKIIGDLKK